MVFIFALFLVLVESRRPRPPLRASTWRGCVGTSIDAPVVTAEQRGIYVLQLEGDRIYVGKSMSNVTARVLEHFTTGGSAWTKKYQPLVQIDPITNATDDLESWERAETLERMWQHGIDNVRGWGYTSTYGISEFERESIFRQLIERKDLCRKCGREGHMMAQCTYRDVAPWVGSGLLPKREAILFEGDSRRVNTARELTKMMKAGGDLPLPLLPLQPPEPGQKAGKPQKKRANGPQPKIAFDEQRPDERQLQQLQQQQQQMQPDQQQKTPPPPPPSPQPQKAKKKAEKPLPKVPSAPPTVPRPAAGAWAGPVAVPARAAGDPLRPRTPPASGPKGTNDTAVSVTPARRGGGATGAFLKVSVASFVVNACLALAYASLSLAGPRGSTGPNLSASLYHVLLAPALEPQTLLYLQWLTGRVGGRTRMRRRILGLVAVSAAAVAALATRLPGAAARGAGAWVCLVVARSAGQALLWLPWLASDAAEDTENGPSTPARAVAAAAAAGRKPSPPARVKQKPHPRRRGVVAASSAAGMAGLVVGWLVAAVRGVGAGV